ncbi:MAG: SurA N-terminal domain-containing protein [Candidatus Dojkabacteria bacterium]|jgi:hypothetical protein|nr:SurA N-terminal domain-containing protein [Candidatus Dojkabacteria bacterium]
MAKIKVKKKEKTTSAPKKTLTIKKPQIKLDKIKFKVGKPNFKKLGTSKGFKIFLMVLVAVFAFILIDLFFQYLNNGYSVAVVDGTRIPKSVYHERLEKQYGQSVAQQLIDEELIKLEAKKADVEVTEEEIQTRLDEIVSSVGGEEAYLQALIANNITEEELLSQIELDLISTKLLEPTLEYTDDDVKAFFEQYSAAIFPNETAELEEGEKLDYELYKEEVKDVYIQQEVSNAQYAWLESLYSEYKIQDNSVNKPKYGVLSATINIVTNLLGDANSNEEEVVEE